MFYRVTLESFSKYVLFVMHELNHRGSNTADFFPPQRRRPAHAHDSSCLMQWRVPVELVVWWLFFRLVFLNLDESTNFMKCLLTRWSEFCRCAWEVYERLGRREKAQGWHMFQHVLSQIRPRDWAGAITLADMDEFGEKYSVTVTWGGETHCLRPSLLASTFPVSHKMLGKLVTISI